MFFKKHLTVPKNEPKIKSIPNKCSKKTREFRTETKYSAVEHYISFLRKEDIIDAEQLYTN